MCMICWTTGNIHKKQTFAGTKENLLALQTSKDRDVSFCTCTAKDGHLCRECKDYQNSNANAALDSCFGQDCTYVVGSHGDNRLEGKICLWCSQALPPSHTLSRNRAVSRRDYDSRHILARSHSTYERPSDEDEFESAELQRALELDAQSQREKASSLPPTPGSEENLPTYETSMANPPPPDILPPP